MQPRLMFCCTMCVLVIGTVSVAMAAPSYQFAFDQTNYLAAPGGTVDVKVYLKEIVGSDPSVLDANGVGMFGAGVVLTNVTPLPGDPAKVATTSNIIPNGSFNDTASGRKTVATTPAITATLSEATDLSVFVHADNPTPGQAAYFMTIGTFKFTAGLTPGITYIQTGANPLGDVNITGVIEALDGTIANASTTITVIPEPSMFVLLGIAALALFGWTLGAKSRGVAHLS